MLKPLELILKISATTVGKTQKHGASNKRKRIWYDNIGGPTFGFNRKIPII